MAVNPSSGEIISLQEAQALIKAFKAKFPGEIKASFVGKEKIEMILAQRDCIGVRIYYGYNEAENHISPVLVGVDTTGKDIIAVLIDKTVNCPNECDITSPLY